MPHISAKVTKTYRRFGTKRPSVTWATWTKQRDMRGMSLGQLTERPVIIAGRGLRREWSSSVKPSAFRDVPTGAVADGSAVRTVELSSFGQAKLASITGAS